MNRPNELSDSAGGAVLSMPAVVPRQQLLGMAVWAVVLLGIYNSGVRHTETLRMSQAYQEDRLWQDAPSLITLLRGHMADEYDLRRYYAYTNALLGRPYYAYYVRPWADWQREFALGQPAPFDDGPLVTPAQPLQPYRDYLVEYPPGFFLFTLLPALLLPPGDYGDLFRILFCTEMALLLGLATWLCTRMRPLLPSPARTPADGWLWGLGGLAALLLGTVSTHRFDPVVSALLCALAWAALAGRPALAGCLLATAVASKGVPLLVAPIWAVYVLLRPQASRAAPDRNALWQALSATLLVGGVFAAGVLLGYGLAPFDSLRYHSQRPLQLESTGAALLGLLQGLWPGTVATTMSYGSFNLIPAGSTLAGLDLWLRRLSAPLLLLGLGAVYSVIGLRLRALARKRALAAMGEWALRGQAVVLVVYMVASKVFSPQYLVWLLPLGLFLSLRAGRGLTVLSLVLFGLTQLVFPALYGFLQTLQPWAFAVLLLRNGALLFWGVLLLSAPLPGRTQRAGAQPKPARCAELLPRI